MVKPPLRKPAPKKKRMAYHNAEPTADLPPGAPRDAVMREFGRRLQAALVEKGWNQSELARRAAAYMPDGGRFGRDNVSNYVRALVLPNPAQLNALCKALGKQPSEILPMRGVPSVSGKLPEFEMRDVGKGKAWLRINQQVDFDVALQIAGLLRGQGDG
jgi:transcriptional regulator with XRE-family HTH domain